MAKFRNSGADQDDVDSPAHSAEEPAQTLSDRSIGDIIGETRNLSAEQVEQILAYQRKHFVRFGEAAVALRLVSHDDVLFALSQQFHYPYAPQEKRASSPELVTLNQPFSHQAEAFRAIRSQVIMRQQPGIGVNRPLAIISPDSGDGKSYFAANLAVALAQLGGRVLLVDADLRSPRQHSIFGFSNDSGLSSILMGRTETRVIQSVEGVPSLFVLPVGIVPPNPLELVERPAFGLLLRELSSKFDHVIVDTPSAVRGADASVIAAKCESALVIARKDVSKFDSLRELVESLANSPAKLAGIVMNEF